MANVPEIRVAGFDGEWSKTNLGRVASILGGNAWKSSDYSDDGEYLVVTISNVSGDVFVDDSTGNHISCNVPSPYMLVKDDILVSLTGNVGRVSKMTGAKGVLNQRVGKIVLHDEKVSKDYLFHVLRNPNFENAMIDAGRGAAQKNIGNLDVLGYNLFVPADKAEQQQIGSVFEKLDNLISQHQHKYDTLVAVKKAMLEKMFPREGEDVPEIRFAGFTDPWEQRKVSDLFETVESGNRLPKTMICKGNIPYVVASNENNGIVDYISENQNDFHGNRMKLFAENSITFSIDNPEAIFVQKVPFFTSNIMRVLHNDKYNYYHIVCFSELIKGLTSYYNWSFKFSGPVVMSSDVFVPVKANGNIDLAEIEKIGKTLSELDNLITLHQRKCEVLKNLKSALLSKMFVGTTE